EAVKEMDFSAAEYNLAFSGIHCPFTLQELGISEAVLAPSDFYAYGHPELKEILAEQYGVASGQVLVPGGGTSLCNFLIAAALLNPGDRAVVETPVYEPLHATIASTGAELLPLLRPPQNNYQLNIQELERILRPPVKLLVLSRLHNPSGCDMSVEVLKQIGDLAQKVGAFVLVDEVYLDFLPPQQQTPAASFHPHLISTASLTKVYGQGTLRIGWAVGPADLIQRCWRINNVMGVNPPAIPDCIAVELFRKGSLARLGEWVRARAAENWRIVEDFLMNQRTLTWCQPAGGIFVCPRFQDGRNADPFVELLQNKYRTLVMKGSYFFQEDGFRLGFGCSEAILRAGLERLAAALQEYQSGKAP
ncbi:MAG: pyridoxal phosphate-dependent aminotransferase, partial [bacterium]